MKHLDSTASVQEWIELAKRAQDLFGRLDLEKVAQHDPEELGKLSRVAGALDEISNGELVEFVPGVDPEDAPELDPVQLRLSALAEVLIQEGFGERLGRVFVSDDNADPTGALRPLDSIPHRQGLPEFMLCVAPDFSPMEGAQGIFVSDRGVFAAMIRAPVTRHRWRIARSRPYDDEREMIATVRWFMTHSSD